MNKTILSIFLLTLLFGCLDIKGAEDGLKKLKELEDKFGLSESYFAPSTPNELADYKLELSYLKKGYRSKQDAGSKALILLIESKLDLVEAQEAYLETGALMKSIGIWENDCTEKGNVKQALKLLEKAKAKQGMALQRRQALNSNYFEEAKKAKVSNIEKFEGTIEGLNASNDGLQKKLKGICKS